MTRSIPTARGAEHVALLDAIVEWDKIHDDTTACR